jgi:hypothetical protein
MERNPGLAVALLEHTPSGSLSVSDDGHYEFVDFTSKSAHGGTLSNAEKTTLERHLAAPRLEAIYDAQDPDGDRCEGEAAGYIVRSRLGTACIIMTDVADESTRESLEFFSTLFDAKAEAKP